MEDKIRLAMYELTAWEILSTYSMSLFEFFVFLPKRLDSQNFKQSKSNFGSLPVSVKKKRNRKDSHCIV